MYDVIFDVCMCDVVLMEWFVVFVMVLSVVLCVVVEVVVDVGVCVVFVDVCLLGEYV